MSIHPDDDLEQKLREGLRRGSLPGAPDTLRRRLAGLPAESRSSRFAGVLSGIRLAAISSAAAVAIAFVIVVRSLSAPVGQPGASQPSASQPGGSVSFTPPASLATGSHVASTGPSIRPSVGPSTPSNFSCAPTTVLPATTSAVTQITDVRVGSHPGYDRIVFEFAGPGRPQLTVAVASPPFVQDASGQPVTVAGRTFLTLKLYDASGYPTYAGPDSFSPGYPALTALVNNGDFEGYVSWVAGLAGQPCYDISTLTGPTRIVVDIQAP
ncbi:MAG: AMIN-like domain-containing (lipo)protein [Candidatus Limnocylindrales bacterium]